jgi:hypothetical protein
VCGLRAEGPSCLSSGETCVQNVSCMALIQLLGGWLQNMAMEGDDGDPEEGTGWAGVLGMAQDLRLPGKDPGLGGSQHPWMQ